MEEIDELFKKLMNVLAKKGIHMLAVLSGEHVGSIGIVGNTAKIRNSVLSAFEAVKRGEANSGQQELVDIILDVISIHFSPSQMAKIMAIRVDKIIPNN